MRIAFVQAGSILEPVTSQLGRLSACAPDRYVVEAERTTMARRRLIELLESLQPGDELLLSSLAALQMDAGEAAVMLSALLDRGAGVRVVDEVSGEQVLDPAAKGFVGLLAGLHLSGRTRPARRAEPEAGLLSEAAVADIRRLAAAGLSLRRIGLIHRRSPKCIAAILRSAADGGARPAMSSVA